MGQKQEAEAVISLLGPVFRAGRATNRKKFSSSFGETPPRISLRLRREVTILTTISIGVQVGGRVSLFLWVKT
jgi:hypothetical protein